MAKKSADLLPGTLDMLILKAVSLKPLHGDALRQDFLYALRVLRRSPGFALLCIGIMAVGIGANTAVFSIVNAVLLKPLPYREPSRIVTLSNVVKTPPTQVTEADGVNIRSIVLFTATLPATPNVGCSLIDSARRYPTRALTFDRSRPASWRGENDQVTDPLGHSRVRLRIGTCSSARNVQMMPRVSR